MPSLFAGVIICHCCRSRRNAARHMCAAPFYIINKFAGWMSFPPVCDVQKRANRLCIRMYYYIIYRILLVYLYFGCCHCLCAIRDIYILWSLFWHSRIPAVPKGSKCTAANHIIHIYPIVNSIFWGKKKMRTDRHVFLRETEPLKTKLGYI